MTFRRPHLEEEIYIGFLWLNHVSCAYDGSSEELLERKIQIQDHQEDARGDEYTKKEKGKEEDSVAVTSLAAMNVDLNVFADSC